MAFKKSVGVVVCPHPPCPAQLSVCYWNIVLGQGHRQWLGASLGQEEQLGPAGLAESTFPLDFHVDPTGGKQL